MRSVLQITRVEAPLFTVHLLQRADHTPHHKPPATFPSCRANPSRETKPAAGSPSARHNGRLITNTLNYFISPFLARFFPGFLSSRPRAAFPGDGWIRFFFPSFWRRQGSAAEQRALRGNQLGVMTKSVSIKGRPEIWTQRPF